MTTARPYIFIPCQHPEHPHKGRNVAHGPCMAKIDKEGNVCGWEPTDEERKRLLPTRKENAVKVKGEPLKVNKETLGAPIVDEFMPREELAPPEGETATLEVDPESEVPGTIEEFAEAGEAGSDFDASDEDEEQEPDDAPDDEDPTEEFDALPEEVAVYTSVPRRRYAVVDADTGEALQLSLLGAQYDDYRVKSERWSLSGGDETSQSEFEGKIVYHDRDLRPGTVVEVVCRGYVKERAPIFKKDTYEGKTVIVIESLVEIELLGYRGGPIEVALNVDGEPKFYDEPRESESTLELEAAEAVNWTGEDLLAGIPEKPEGAPECFGTMATKDDDECWLWTGAAAEIVEDEEPGEADPDGSDFGGDMFDNPGVEHEG